MKKKRKNSNYKANFELEAQAKGGNQNKLLIGFIAAFLALVLIVGLIFGVRAIVRDRNSVLKYDGEYLTEAEVSFFASYYKKQLMTDLSKKGISAVDTEDFWNTSYMPVARTYGDYLKTETEKYLKNIIVANRIFDKYDYLSREEKKEIKRAAEEILAYRAGNDVDKFNEEAGKYGFTYDDFEGIVTKLYKANSAKSAVFGTNSSKILTETELCDTYFGEYSKMKLIFIRVDKEFVLDENGNRVTEEGKDVMRDLTAEEILERENDIAAIRSAIEALENDGDRAMSAEMFEIYLKKYGSGDDYKDTNGYFFHRSSSYTQEFAEEFPEIVDAASYMATGSFLELGTSVGTCFVYKMPFNTSDRNYLDTSEENNCFTDFYTDAASASFIAMLDAFSKDVEFSDAYLEFDFIKLPYNTDYVPRL